MSNFLYGGNVHANGIRQHYLRYGGTRGAGAIRSSSCRASPVRRSRGFVGERFGESFDTYILDVRRGLSEAGAALTMAWTRRPPTCWRSRRRWA